MHKISKVLLTSVALFTTIAAVTATKVSSSSSSGSSSQSQHSLIAVGKKLPALTTTSGAAEIALAEHLKKTGAVMYGAFWCPHCYTQRQTFGTVAWSKVNYVECAKDGEGANVDACNKAGIKLFPTWKINGKSYEGTMSLFKIAKLTNYQGPQTFKNRLK
jgi:thiol-disulfide isomerase/thioredoxin